MSGRRRYGLICLLLAALSIPGKIVAQTEPIPTEIDAVFADYDNTVSPGCALGVILDGELIYKRGYGMANLELGVALSPRSVFRTGSVGKQFTAMAIAILAEKGTISLDDSLSKHFPEFPDWAEMVTIRHLVHHTSGVRDYLTLTWLAGMGDDDYYTDEFALDLLSRQQNLNFQSGEKYL
jgi:CubicO group peptidase (beta-lactamase class C family)